MRILKFGGTSVANSQRLKAAASIVAAHRSETTVGVVVSAMAGVTDGLLATAQSAIKGEHAWLEHLAPIYQKHVETYKSLLGYIPCSFMSQWHRLLYDIEKLAQNGLSNCIDEESARFSGWGERLSVPLFVAALSSYGISANPFSDEPVILNGMGLEGASASVLATRSWLVPNLASSIMQGYVPVLAGYIARDAYGVSTTVGRNGSDYSAAVIAAALGAESLYIYSDVAGIYTADPRFYPDAERYAYLTYSQAAELASAGAKVLHPCTIEPLIRSGIPLYLRSSFMPDAPGTDIIPDSVALRERRELGVLRFGFILCAGM
jgi:aspartokinase/homoserine dehydrogenase 1